MDHDNDTFDSVAATAAIVAASVETEVDKQGWDQPDLIFAVDLTDLDPRLSDQVIGQAEGLLDADGISDRHLESMYTLSIAYQQSSDGDLLELLVSDPDISGDGIGIAVAWENAEGDDQERVVYVVYRDGTEAAVVHPRGGNAAPIDVEELPDVVTGAAQIAVGRRPHRHSHQIVSDVIANGLGHAASAFGLISVQNPALADTIAEQIIVRPPTDLDALRNALSTLMYAAPNVTASVALELSLERRSWTQILELARDRWDGISERLHPVTAAIARRSGVFYERATPEWFGEWLAHTCANGPTPEQIETWTADSIHPDALEWYAEAIRAIQTPF